MKKNIGSKDRAVRIGLALLILILFFSNSITGTLAVILLIALGVLIITSFSGTCPLYLPFGINTKKKS